MNEPREIRAVHVIHHHEVLVFMQADFMNGDDIRVLQAAGGRSFDAETAHLLGAGQRAKGNHFHGDDAVEAHLPRAIDNPHAATGDFVEQLVIAKAACAGGWVGGMGRGLVGWLGDHWLIELEEARGTETARGVGRQFFAASRTGSLHGRNHGFT